MQTVLIIQTVLMILGGSLFLQLAHADEGKTVQLAGMKAAVPEGWIVEKPSNTMRIHQFKLPKVQDDPADAELAIFFFKTASGTVEENLKRQVAKFNPADGKDAVDVTVGKIKVGKIEATYQDVSGTYVLKSSPMAASGKPLANYRQLYVVFETADGQYYMTLLGPKATIAHHKKSFEDWLASFQ